MIWLDVALTLEDGSRVRCGEIVVREPDKRGRSEGAFRYAKEYLSHPGAFALDPVTLPLSEKEYPTDRAEGIHAVFEDALPDDWGRKVLIRNAGLTGPDQRPANLLGVIGARGLGALSFSFKDSSVQEKTDIRMDTLEDLLNAAMQFDAGKRITRRQLDLLHLHGSSPGGARPKGVIQKEDGSLWIAKFPRMSDACRVEQMEAACLSMAGTAGLKIPEFEVIDVADRPVLLVRRFDVTSMGGRHHMISMQTLLGAQGYYHLGYQDLFGVLQKYSSRPSEDIPLLFTQMVFNAAITNTDDHLKNFCMLHMGSGYRLSPAYDLVPDISGQREHTLSFPQGMAVPDRLGMISAGKALGIQSPEKILDRVTSAVIPWQKVFKSYAVPDGDIQRFEPGIQRRLDRLSQ